MACLAIKVVHLVRVYACACLTGLFLFVGFFVSISESAYIGLGELLSSGAFAYERTGLPAH